MTNTSNNKKSCFIITPIGSADSDIRRKAEGVITSAIKPILESNGFEMIVPHYMTNPGAIEMAIIQQILECDLVIANLTGLNPNVMYELAVRHSFGKPVVCIAERNTRLPFDIHSIRVLPYTDDMSGTTELQRDLPGYIDSAMNDDGKYNPIINAKSDLQAESNATGDQKVILNKLDMLLNKIHPQFEEPKNSYRKIRPDGSATYYICTESDAKLYGLLSRGYKLIVQNLQHLDGGVFDGR